MRLLSIVSLSFCCLFFVPGCWAADDSSTQERIQRLEKENTELRQIINQLQQRVEAIEEQPLPSPKSPSAPSPNVAEPLLGLEKRLETLEESEEKYEKGWLRSLRRKWFELGGELQLEYRDTQSESDSPAGRPDDPYGQFQIDHMRLSPRVRFSDDILLEADLDAGQQATSDLQELYLLWRHLPLDSQLTVGQQKKFFRPKRRTESYPLAGTAFWHDRDLGMTLSSQVDSLYAYVSVMNGLRLNDDEIGEDESFPIVADDLDDLKANEQKEVGVGLGWSEKSKTWGKLDLMLFGTWDRLSDDDEEFLLRLSRFTVFGGDDDRSRYGFNVEYDLGDWNLFSQYIKSEDGALDRVAWYIQSSYAFETDLSYLLSIEPLVRYGELNLNFDPFPANSMLWDRQRWTFATILELLEDIRLRAEYTLNDEETGNGDIRNDEALLQLEMRF